MADMTVQPSQIPLEALSLPDKTRRIDQAQLFFAKLTLSMEARAKGKISEIKQSELHKNALEELHKYLSMFGALPLLVEPKALVLFGDAVTQENALANAAPRLHAEGIGQLTFLPELSSAELEKFEEILLAPTSPHSSCADRIWESELPHIRTDLAENFSIPGMSEVAVTVEVGKVMEFLFESLRQNTNDLRRFLQEDPGASEPKDGPLVNGIVFAGCAAGDELKTRLQTSIAQDEASLFPKALERIFLHLEGGKSERLDAVENFLLDLVDNRLRQNDLVGVGAIVRRIEDLEFQPELAMTGYRLRCFIQGQLSKPERLNLVSAMLVQGKLDDSESVQRYLNTLDAEAVAPLIDLLSSITLQENRQMVCEALIKMGKGMPEPFVNTLKSDQGQLARDMLYIIDACDFSEKFSCFEEALKSPNRAIQLDCLSLLSKPKNIQSEQANRLLIGMLNTVDVRLRIAALKGLQSSSSPRVGKALLDVMQSEAFEKRDLEERQLFYETLGNVNLPAALPFLSQRLSQKKKGFFGAARQREDKLLAVQALSRMVMIPAYKIIQGAAEDSNNDDKVREEALAALAVMRRALFGESSEPSS